MSGSTKLEYAIIGGGISGMVLALALHQRGLSVTVYESAAQFGEIGAGVGFTENVVQAMHVCHDGIYEVFEEICTHNQWASKEHIWFDVYDASGEDAASEHIFGVPSNFGSAGIHRARFLDGLIQMMPEGMAQNSKRFESAEKGADGRWEIRFVDGSTATADAVIGCDGIKSSVRRWMYGEDHPCTAPTYTYKYAYRALIPMEDAIGAIGEERAMNCTMLMGPGAHVLTFPVDHGRICNMVAFVTSKDDWSDYHKLTRSAHRSDAQRDFKGFSSDVHKLLALAKDDLDVWAIFHLGDNPLPHYNKSSVVLVGDAAHATSPHHGAGAGMCVEDSAVLAELLALPEVRDARSIEKAFAVYNEVRRERDNFVVQSSAHQGEAYEFLAPGIGKDFDRIKKEMMTRNARITDVDIRKICDDARDALRAKLGDA